MGLFQTLHFITQHPYNRNHKLRAWWRFMHWQLRSRLTEKPKVYDFTDKAKLIISKGMTGATGNLYCGLHEFHEMGFLLHLLREEDTFMDIGANVGTYTVLASAHIGAMSIAIEPIPATYNHLVNNINQNRITSKVTSYNIALGSKVGKVAFTQSLDTANHVAQSGEGNTVYVQLETIDTILGKNNIPILIKIDVEGYETEVIHGGLTTLKDDNVKALIIELGGAGERYGYDETRLHHELFAMGFRTFQYNAFTRTLKSSIQIGATSTVYIRDFAFVQQRLKTAKEVKLPAMSI